MLIEKHHITFQKQELTCAEVIICSVPATKPGPAVAKKQKSNQCLLYATYNHFNSLTFVLASRKYTMLAFTNTETQFTQVKCNHTKHAQLPLEVRHIAKS